MERMAMSQGGIIWLATCCPAAWSSCSGQEVLEVDAEQRFPATAVVSIPLARLVDSLGASARDVSFLVDKSDRTFTVLVKKEVVKVYPCVLGEAPVGDKYYQRDRRTPEGSFTFRGKRVHGAWHKFIWVDYPNEESWRRFRERQAMGAIPAGKDIGGEIGIHGVPVGKDHWITQGVDWTWGCIALRNADVDEIYPYIVPNRTMMEVRP